MILREWLSNAALVGVVVLYARHALRCAPADGTIGRRLSDYLRLPDIASAVAMVVAGLLWVTAMRVPNSAFPDWAFLFFAPVWGGWCLGGVTACLIGRRRASAAKNAATVH